MLKAELKSQYHTIIQMKFKISLKIEGEQSKF